MNRSFIDLGISPPILKAIDDMGFKVPTEVQSKAIPHILNKKDLIVMSKTGSGKTAVFGVSLLQQIDPGSRVPQGLILTPTRELAVQVDSDLKKLSKYLGHKTAAVYGKHSMNTELQSLKRGVSIITGTPGRVFDHIEHGSLQTSDIHFVVLDEADRMLDMGFIGQVLKIIKALPRDRVTLLFSATIPPEVRRICRDYMKDPVTIEIASATKTVDTINQCYYRINANEKRTQLHRLLLIEQPESCMIFCNTRMAVDRVQTFLTRKGLACEALHGDIPQGKRLKTMEQFKRGDFHLLVATDVAARGIHIEDLSLVINYDVPVEKDSYVHRIGRTGRAGKGGRAISLVTSDDIITLYEIEEHIGALITETELPSDAEFSEKSAQAGAWLEQNSIKAREPHHTTAQSAGGTGTRPNYNKASREHGYNRNNRGKTANSFGVGENSGREAYKNDNSKAAGQGFNKADQPNRNRYPRPGDDKQRQTDKGRQTRPVPGSLEQRNSNSSTGRYNQNDSGTTPAARNKYPNNQDKINQSGMRKTNQNNTGRTTPGLTGGGRTANAGSSYNSSTADDRQKLQQAGLIGQQPKEPLFKRLIKRILGK